MTDIHKEDKNKLSILFAYLIVCSTIIVNLLQLKYLAFVGLIFALTDMTMTHIAIFGKAKKKAVEINIIPSICMRYFKKYWVIPISLIIVTFFTSFYFFPNPFIYFILGIQTMVIFNNYTIILKQKREKSNI